jgi:MerR family transcriptional regulator, light-induced transcriptional regulator
MSELMVSAGEAARRLGVAPATIQRWVDSGVLNAERTPGGHRRIYVTELRRLIAASRPATLSAPLLAWFDVLMTGDAAKVKAALLASRQKTGSWAETADEVASTLAEIGRSWEAGACQIFEEHAATEALRRAAASCVAEIPCSEEAPRAALFTIENERHTLGLALAELVVMEAGWRSTWIGEGPPADELGALLEKFAPKALVVSASPASAPAAVARYQAPLTALAREAGLKLVLAGGGSWKTTADAVRVLSFTDLPEALA